MAKDSIASNKAHQELTCAQAFVDWLDSSNGLSHKLRRAESVFGGRWDFVAQATDRGSWLGIEIKSLVLTDDRRQFSDWESFFTHVSKRLAPRDNGSYLVSVTIPWRFRQQQASDLVEPFIEALNELNLLEGQDGNLGPGIARRFSGWPTKPPASDQTLWTEQRILKTVSQPQDLTVVKDSDTGSSIEVGMSMGEAFDVRWTLVESLLSIFEPEKKGDAKPNIQLAEAKAMGAPATALLLDCHMP